MGFIAQALDEWQELAFILEKTGLTGVEIAAGG
jgi:hypothetical protein